MQCPGNNAGAESVEYSSDAGESFHPMSGTDGCNSVGSTSRVVVDGNQDGHILADLQCLNKQRCTLENPAPVDNEPTDPKKDRNNHFSAFGAGVHAQVEASGNAKKSKTAGAVTQILLDCDGESVVRWWKRAQIQWTTLRASVRLEAAPRSVRHDGSSQE